MNFRSPKTEDLKGMQLPDSIFASVVSSLYRDPKSLAIGTACAIIAPLVLYWRSDDPAQLVFSAIFLLVGAVRLYSCLAFSQRVNVVELSRSENETWESVYTWLGGIFVFLLGSWYAVSAFRTEDPYVELLALLLATAHLTGLIGRNFGSEKVIRTQSSILSVLLIGGTLLAGDVYHFILAAFMAPFLIAVHVMSSNLREMLLQSALNALDNSTIANRFDVALDNIAHGIAMFDHRGKFVVANARFTKLVGLDDWDVIDSEISILTAARIIGSNNLTLASVVRDCLSGGESRQFNFEIATGQVIEADYSSMPNGGVLILADVSERRATEQAILELANFDHLTNLPNRRHFIEEINRNLCDAKGELRPCAMFFIDLDKFKEVNDTLGHAVGDSLLKTVSIRLNAILPVGGINCRFGGDEFVVIVPGFSEIEHCVAFAEEVIAELNIPAIEGKKQINVGASVGIALSPNDGTNPEDLLQFADAALYEAKAKGRNTFVFYNEALGEAIKFRRELEVDLRKAITENTLELYYQPLINLKYGRIKTCEALLRWDHPIHGFISPATFIPIAEESGIIVDLGEYVLRRAMRECQEWEGETRVAVNVSTIQFHKSNIETIVSRLLDETGLEANRLEIEITESAMMDEIDDVATTLNAISALGVNISLDDFGTGFSNLGYLHVLPFNKVKIDRCFIENAIADDRSLVLLKGVVDLIKRLKLSVVLEGIENNAHINIVSEHVNVDEVQGFLFGKPMPHKDIKSLIGSASTKITAEDEIRSA